ncbi:hypothetical protein AGMMS50229_12860 [Campylobacterota bacterium]|nr:hypothetical protein AGMMS50229_12860 [Campylobacterota bacterium]
MCGKRFSCSKSDYGQLPAGWDHKYTYSHIGYNFQATDLGAAVGLAQLEKLPQNVAARRTNYDRLMKLLAPLEQGGKLMLPRATPNSNPSWFGFPITLVNGATRGNGTPIKRLEIVRYLEDHNVQTRLLFAGNITRQPCFVTGGAHPRKLADFRVSGDLTNTDLIMNNTFWIGVYPRITQAQIAYMAELIGEAVL